MHILLASTVNRYRRWSVFMHGGKRVIMLIRTHDMSLFILQLRLSFEAVLHPRPLPTPCAQDDCCNCDLFVVVPCWKSLIAVRTQAVSTPRIYVIYIARMHWGKLAHGSGRHKHALWQGGGTHGFQLRAMRMPETPSIASSAY